MVFFPALTLRLDDFVNFVCHEAGEEGVHTTVLNIMTVRILLTVLIHQLAAGGEGPGLRLLRLQ